MSATPVAVTDTSFATAVLASDKPVLVDFWAAWCSPCKLVAPILHEIAAEHPGLTVATLDVDVNPAVSTQYQVMSLPTLIVFCGGQPVKVIVGAKPKAVLLQELADFLG